MSVSNLTASERIELSQLASRIHRRLAQQRGVYPEPAALQTARWLTTRAYMALSLEESDLDFTEAEPSTPASRRSNHLAVGHHLGFHPWAHCGTKLFVLK